MHSHGQCRDLLNRTAKDIARAHATARPIKESKPGKRNAPEEEQEGNNAQKINMN